MNRAAALVTLASLVSYAAPSLAVTPERLRGTIEQVGANDLTLKTRDGQTVTVALDSSSGIVGVKKSSLSDVRKGDFIGTATKGPPSFMVALEVVVFPDSMRGAGEGQYPWDSIPDTTAGAAANTGSTMTNGTIAASSAGPAPTTNSTMTNGTIAGGSASGSARTITVTYHDPKTGNGTAKILLPPSAPVVRLEPGTRALLTQGAQAFIVATGTPGHLTAARVLVGENGVTPPM